MMPARSEYTTQSGIPPVDFQSEIKPPRRATAMTNPIMNFGISATRIE
jgi:hypothetical protein